jgi:coenzyme F420-0:L-glutamate ligase/coenzyme F420-1:gamma-L-glutamate ligase
MVDDASAPGELRLVALPGVPLVNPGDDLAQLTVSALSAAALQLRSDDILVFAQKVVSKAEGRRVDLKTVIPGAQALDLARTVQKDPRLVELILRESRRIVRASQGVLIVEHRLGFVMANAGIDQSNVAAETSGEHAVLLPEDPDGSARRLRERLAVLTGHAPAVIINDSFGRPWRLGTVGVAIGCAGLQATLDVRGRKDLFGRTLRVSVVAHADELASAASLLMGQADESRPIVLVRGLRSQGAPTPAAALVRPAQENLFP